MQNSVSDKKYLKLLEWIMIRYKNNYNYHNCFVQYLFKIDILKYLMYK